ncbi:hypothetical protein G3M48_001092 [Beauveria asiatica]|uniref:Hydrophobin n=1 Tax=Beauveria asiatica TaxID=1069075 RepID=A0AAW0S0T8_9HYPO
MKFSLATIALAATVVASPTGGNPPSGGTCNVNGNNNGKVVCCNSAIPIVGQLLCNVLAIGNTCNSNQKTYCCNTNSQAGSLINVVALNCVSIL